jgi:hypothetical protein
MYVRTPITYTSQSIGLKIKKNDQGSGTVFKVFVTNFNQYAPLDITLLPKGFFSPYSRYRLEFWGNNGNTLVEFIGKDGKQYSGIDFFFDADPVANTIINLNAIDNAYYD